MTHFEYKGYLGSIEPDVETGMLFGKLAYIRDLVTYEADTVARLEKEFRTSVDEYLISCEELGKEPNQPCKGVFNVRTGPELHREAVIASKGRSLNAFVCEALREKLDRCNAVV